MRVCIVCQNDVSGKKAVPVQEDAVIRSIRRVKQALRIAKNDELYVCDDDLARHREKRKSFERSMIFFGVLSAAVVLLLIGTIVLSGKLDIFAILSAFMIGAFILLFSVLFKYAPNLRETPARVGNPQVPEELMEKAEKPGRKAGRKPKRQR